MDNIKIEITSTLGVITGLLKSEAGVFYASGKNSLEVFNKLLDLYFNEWCNQNIPF